MQALLLAALVSVAAASGRGVALSGARAVALPTYAGRGYGYGPVRVANGGYANDYAEPRPYHYQYAVDDPNYGPMFNKEEQSDGSGNVQGSYAVNLPDGRTQYVKYVADGYNGFNAEVTYEGYANHPQVARGYGYGSAVGHGVVRAGAGLAGRRAVGYGTGLVGRRAVGYGAGLVGRRAVGLGAGLVGRTAGYTPVYRSSYRPTYAH